MADMEDNTGDAMEVTEELSSHSSDSDSDQDEMNDEQEQQIRLKIKELREQLSGNALYYAGHVSLIAALRDLMELEEARKAREKMNEVYPLTAELWLEWIKDEQKVCTTDEERQYIITLFDRAVKDYMNVGVWVEYVMFMLGCGDLSATREVSERALTAVGTHVAEGVLVWQVVTMVEKQVYAGLLKPGAVPTEQDVKDQEKQLRRIQTLFRRQTRVPLLNVDYDSFLEEAAEFFEGDIETHMKNDLKKTQAKLQQKVPFENELVRAANDTEKLSRYRQYIDHAKDVDNPAAVQNLYERAVTDHCLEAGLWEEYVKFVVHQFPGMDYVVLPVCERSQRNCPWSAALCELHIEALQRFAVEGEEGDTATKIKSAMEKGLGCGLQSASEMVRMWMAYLVFLRRQIEWDKPHDTQLTTFREAVLQAITYVDQYFGEEGDIESIIPRFLAQIEAECVHNPERAREIWNDTIMKRNNNFKNANLWLEFINLERSYGSEKHCRKLFRRALERVWEWVEVIAAAYKRFEEETGTLESMEDFNRRYEDRMVVVNKKRAEDALKAEAEEGHKDFNSGRKPKEKQNRKERRKAERGDNNNDATQDRDVFKHPLPVAKSKKVSAVKQSTHVEPNSSDRGRSRSNSGGITLGSQSDVTPPPGFKNAVAPPPGFKSDVAPPPGFKSDAAPPPGYKSDIAPPPGYESPEKSSQTKRKAQPSEDEPNAKAMKAEAALRGVLTENDPKDDMCTIFLSNLDFSADKDDIIPVFQQCGDIADFRLVKDFRFRSKGFGYLVFKTQEGAVKGLDLDRALVKGRPVYVSPYDPVNHTHQFKYSEGIEKEKLFIKGLSQTMTENDIHEAFLPHGKLKSVRLCTYRNGHSKGNCYIEYYDAATAEKVRQAMHGTELEGKTINVFISDPSASKRPVETPTPTVLGGGNKTKKGIGMRGKGMFNLMPRALQRASETSKPDPETPDSGQQTKKMSNDDFRNMLLKK